MSGYLLDTHVWFWLLFDEPALSQTNRNAIAKWQADREVFLSPMSVWEAAQKQAAGRLHLRGTVEEWLAESVSDDGLQLIDLEVRDLIASTRLPGGIHGDPTDRILAATAREHNFTLVTHDTELRRYAKQGHLQVHKV